MVNFKSLKHIEDKFYYKGRLFTGVGFRTCREKVKDLCQFDQGINVGNYRCSYFPEQANIPHVDMDYIEFMGEYLDNGALYKNEEFSGIAYELEEEQEFCLGQHYIKDGDPLVSIRWYPSGENESLIIRRENLIQIFDWFEDGSLKDIDLSLKKDCKTIRYVSVRLNELKQLQSIWIKEGYFEWILKYSSQFEYHYFETINSFKNFAVSPRFSLIDLGINDTVFHSIAANNGFKDLSEITISHTSLSEETILELVSVNTLKKINLRNSKHDLLSVAKALKHLLPDCSIRVNGQEITIS